VQEAIQEALKLEAALADCATERRIAMLHYAPIEATVQGEPPRSSRFSAAAGWPSRWSATRSTSSYHGHAHRGGLEGRTVNGIPVYNVAMPLLQRSFPDRPAFRLFEVKRQDGEGT